MGVTNIHRPAQLVSRTHTFQDQALIQPFSQPVLIISGPLSQSDVDKYEWCLRTAHLGRWVTQDPQGTHRIAESAGEAMKVPMVRVSPVLASRDHGSEREYVLVLEGNAGAGKVKVVIEDSVEGAATAMMHAALNGFSTMFSAAILRRPGTTIWKPSIGPQNGRLRRVESLDGSPPTNNDEVTIDLLC